MLTVEQIISLTNAGFTKDDIMKLATEQETNQATQETAQQTVQEQQTAQEQQPAQEQQTAQHTEEVSLADVIKSNQAVMENITKLTAAVQANAIKTAVQPTGQPSYTAEQAIAEIIAPPRKERS